MSTRDAVFPAGRHDLYASHAYSAAIRSKDLLFVSGQVGSRSDGSPEPDFEAQVRLAFVNLEATLKAGGCGLNDIVDVTTTIPIRKSSSVRSCPSRPKCSPGRPTRTGRRSA